VWVLDITETESDRLVDQPADFDLICLFVDQWDATVIPHKMLGIGRNFPVKKILRLGLSAIRKVQQVH